MPAAAARPCACSATSHSRSTGRSPTARESWRRGISCFSCLSWREELSGPKDAADAAARVDCTVQLWRRWLEAGTFPDHPWRWTLQRSALVLKGLTYEPTGAMVAALTTSLPETPGGERNWDYRYTWIRDATFTLWSLHVIGFDQEAREFMEFICDLFHGRGPEAQIMFGIGGETELTEKTLDHLSGYVGSRPVRIGNAAYDQRQNDVYGALLDSIYIHAKTREGVPEQMAPIVFEQAEAAASAWHLPDQGIWEARGEPKHYVSSKLMCWVALDRAARLARDRGRNEPAESWEREANAVQAEILERGVSERGDLPPALRDRCAGRVAAADPAGALPAARRRARAGHGAGDRRRADRARAGASLPRRPDR